MIIKDESAAHQDAQYTQPPPPEYTEAVVRPEPTYVQQPTPATQLQYPPQPSTYNQNNTLGQQSRAQTGQDYRNRRKLPSLTLARAPKVLNVCVRC